MKDAYETGLTEGHNYFNTGVTTGNWNWPENPYQKETEEYREWERGFSEGSSDSESSYEA